MGIVSSSYSTRARLRPVMILLLPVVLALTVWAIHVAHGLAVLERLGAGMLIGLVATFGLSALLAQVGRDQGKREEVNLWRSWGGSPTIQMLRHGDTSLCGPTLRARYHANLRRLMPDVHLPTPEEEVIRPGQADETYETCIKYLIGRTRDTAAFPLLFEENVNYGFRRNLWAMRPTGIVLATLGIALVVYPTAAAWMALDSLWVAGAAVAIVDAALLAWWILRITPSWVFIPARAYADRLLEASDTLTAQITSGG